MLTEFLAAWRIHYSTGLLSSLRLSSSRLKWRGHMPETCSLLRWCAVNQRMASIPTPQLGLIYRY